MGASIAPARSPIAVTLLVFAAKSGNADDLPARVQREERRTARRHVQRERTRLPGEERERRLASGRGQRALARSRVKSTVAGGAPGRERPGELRQVSGRVLVVRTVFEARRVQGAGTGAKPLNALRALVLREGHRLPIAGGHELRVSVASEAKQRIWLGEESSQRENGRQRRKNGAPG